MVNEDIRLKKEYNIKYKNMEESSVAYSLFLDFLFGSLEERNSSKESGIPSFFEDSSPFPLLCLVVRGIPHSYIQESSARMRKVRSIFFCLFYRICTLAIILVFFLFLNSWLSLLHAHRKVRSISFFW